MDARGSQTNAKEDTRLLLLSGALTTDLSQYKTNLTSQAGGGYETNSARAALSERFEVYVRCVFTAAEIDLILVAHHDAGLSTSTFVLGTDSSGNFRAIINAATVIWTGPAAPAGDVSIAWSMRPNPGATGAGDARISEFTVYDHTAGDYLAIEQVTHATPTTSTDYTLSVGGIWTGSELVSKPATAPTKVRVSASYHPNVEFAQDWVAARAAYAGTLNDGPREPLGPITVASGAADSGHLVGRHQVGYAAAHARACRRRSWSNLTNDVFVDVDTMLATPGPVNWHLPDFGDGTYALMLPWLRWVSVPSGCTHAWVRVQVKSWVTAGASVPIGIRCYAMNRPSTVDQIGQTPAPAFAANFREATLTANHTSTGVGEWLELGLLPLPIFNANVTGWKNTVHLCLAYAIDPAGASGNDANARLQINAWHARPVQQWTPGGLE